MVKPWEVESQPQGEVGAQGRSNPIAAIGGNLWQGVTFGFGDEISAGIGAAARAPFNDRSLAENYQEQLDIQRGSLQSAREQYPKTSFASELAGGIGTGAGAAGLTKQALSRAPQAASLVSRIPAWLRLAGGGAAGGAAYGAGTAEEGERGAGAVRGGLTGAVAAPVGAGALHVAGRLGSKVAAPIARMATNTPKTQAVRNVMRLLSADDITPEEAFTRLERLGPDAVMADLGPNLQGGARGIAGMSGKGRTLANKFLTGRQASQSDRLIEAASPGQKLDLPRFKQSFEQWMTRRLSQSDDLYKEAFSSPLNMTPRLKTILNRDLIKPAVRKGAKYLNSEGGGAGNVRLLHYTKMALDDDISTALSSGKRHLARILIANKKQLLEEIDDQVPSYQQARNLFAGESAVRDAGALGRQIFRGRKNLEAIDELIGTMSDGERTAFRMGALRGLVDEIESAGDAQNIAQKIIKGPRARATLRLVFPDDNAFDDFARQAEAHSVFTQTRNKALHGSRTYEALGDVDSIGKVSGPVAAAMGRGDSAGVALQLFRHLGFGEVSEETLEEMAKILFTPAAGLRITSQAAARGAAQRIPRTARRGAVVGGASVLAGSQPDQ